MNLKEAEREILQIKLRNKRVELDKAWEISIFRRLLILAFTYLIIGLFLQALRISKPWLNAAVPALAFALSTLTMPIFKSFWAKYFYKK